MIFLSSHECIARRMNQSNHLCIETEDFGSCNVFVRVVQNNYEVLENLDNFVARPRVYKIAVSGFRG